MIHRLADTGLLVELDDLAAVLRLDAAVRAAQDEGRGGFPESAEFAAFSEVIDVLPAARTLMLTVPAGSDLGRLEHALTSLDVDALVDDDDEADDRVVEIPVIYDGPDLEEVASLTGLSAAEVVEAHTQTPWRSAFGGFAPGFFYLVEGDPRLEVPRRSEPRTAVPDGAVALAGTFSAVYPRTSPGGWQLIGHTEEAMWDSDRTDPALLSPGVLVRFVDAGGAS